MRNRRRHAQPQAQWRVRIRSTSSTLLWVVALLIVGSMYLAVNAKLAQAGRQVINLERRKDELLRANASLAAQLAELTTPEQMWARAAALGFHPAGPAEVEYLKVEGYVPPTPFVAPRPPAASPRGPGALSPAYTETLGEWLARWMTATEVSP